MGSVLYLDRGMRRKGAAAAAAKIQSTHGTPSILRPGYNCWTVARAERVALLVDAADYFKAFYEAALRAKRSIPILGGYFNSRTRLHFDPLEPRINPNAPPALLGEFLNWLVQRRSSLHVHVLNWDYPMVFGTDREFPPLYGFGWTPARRVHLRYDDTHPVGGSHHQKVVLIDDTLAFLGGIDLTVRRWDTPGHAPDDPRRVAYGKPYPPFHDLMVALDGEAARQLALLTRERWLAATGQKLKPVTFRGVSDNDPWPEGFPPDLQAVEVGIARTVPPRAEQPAIREVEKLYLDMIAVARKTLYIENQYFTAPRICAALEKRLAEPEGPEIVLVLRLLSHGWLEEHTMHVLRTRLIERLRKADRFGRFRVYYPHVPGLPEGCCLDVHSKLMVVDDRILRIGSSNLCNRSFVLDTDADIALEARGRPQVANAIRRFRDRLVAEHLGVPVEKLRVEIERSGSLAGAIKLLAHDGRSMRELDSLPEWSDAVVNVAAVADPDEPIALDELLLDRHQEGEAGPEKPAWTKLALIALLVLALTALCRWTPLAHAAVESIVAGAIHMRVWHVALGTAIGLLPGTLATTIFGEAIETALTGTGDVNWWLVGLAVGLLAGGILAVKRWFTKMSRRIHAADEQASRQPG